MTDRIPLHRQKLPASARAYIDEVLASGKLSPGVFSARCERWLESALHSRRAFLTPSCTAALQGCAQLAGLGPGDEVIVPAWTFAASAAALRTTGATPVLVDTCPQTLNMTPALAAAAIGPRTRALLAVHYAGVACDLTGLRALADEHGLVLIEDAAQALHARDMQSPCGSVGDVAALSFHSTKNTGIGEGGALLVNRPDLVATAEVLMAKGTNFADFQRGQTDHYQWWGAALGGQLAEVTCALLLAMLEDSQDTLRARKAIWQRYQDALADLPLQTPAPTCDRHNAHIFFLLAESADQRGKLLSQLHDQGIDAAAHYPCLAQSHAVTASAMAQVYGATPVADRAGCGLIRLPLWAGMSDEQVDRVIRAVNALHISR